jgi:chorismate dehydratase
MAIKVGRVPYIHCEPFYFDMERRGIELYEMMPSTLVSAAQEGEVDAGPMPLVDCFKLEDRFQPVSGFCVASMGPAGSVFLYSTRAIEELGGSRIGVTDEDSTAPKLLQVLLNLKYQAQPEEYVSLREPNDAFLLVGNRALRQRRGARGFPHKYDLGQEWSSWTGLPFVFSRWMVRKGLDSKDIALLEDTLYVGLEDGVDSLYHLNEPRDDLLMLPKDIVEYIQGIRYYIGLSEQKAIDQFRQYVEQLDG